MFVNRIRNSEFTNRNILIEYFLFQSRRNVSYNFGKMGQPDEGMLKLSTVTVSSKAWFKSPHIL